MGVRPDSSAKWGVAVRLVAWNIRAGGGVRAEGIVDQLITWAPDVIALSEFRGTEPSVSIARELNQAGFCHQRSTADPAAPAVNALLIASRYPLRVVSLRRAPVEPRRWLHVIVNGPLPMAVMAIHIPNRVTGAKYPFMNSVMDVVTHWRGPPAVIMGDTNSGHIGLDEESPAFNSTEDLWLQQMNQRRWRDVFRMLYPDKPEYTWYSPNGRNGFRLDQMYLHPALACKVHRFRHQWGGHALRDNETVNRASQLAAGERLEILSDHAAMILDLWLP